MTNIQNPRDKNCHFEVVCEKEILPVAGKNEIVVYQPEGGVSSKDGGNKIMTIMQVECSEVYHELVDSLLAKGSIIMESN